MDNNNPNASKALTFGILSLVFSWTGILGLIFAIVGMKKAKAYAAETGVLAGKAKVGKILSIIGLIGSIFMVLYWIIIIAFGGAAIAQNM